MRRILIDFDLDEDGTPELPASPSPSTDRQALARATAARRCHRFTDYMRKFFRILHVWDAIRVGAPYLDVKIRVLGRKMNHMKDLPHENIPLCEDLTGLPHVSGAHSFELINYDYRMVPNHGIYQLIDHPFFVPPGSLSVILSQLPQLHSAVINVDIPRVHEIDRIDQQGLGDASIRRTPAEEGETFNRSNYKTNVAYC